MTIKREKVSFRPRARLIETIGEDLIKDEMAGVIELVKNAYDADAREVSLRFVKLTQPDEASIIVQDDGHGMTKKNLVDGWLSPATGSKIDRGKSPDNRIMLGRKGIGRFSAMRLGGHLKLETKPGSDAPGFTKREANAHYRLIVDWSTFKNPNRFLEQIKSELVVERGSRFPRGTRLTISKLNDVWDKRRVQRLQRELKLLLSPLPHEDKDFSVVIDLSHSRLDPQSIKSYSGEVEPYAIPAIADYQVEAQIQESGEYRLSYKRMLYADRDREEVTASDRGSDIRNLWPEDYWHQETETELELDAGTSRLPCGPLKLRFHMWDRDPELLLMKGEALAAERGTLGVRAVGKLLDEISGVSIYRDGFRVRPYGDAGYDWLGLGRRRVQMPASRLGPNQMFGLTEISTLNNPALEDKASREGLKENDAYQALQACALAVIAWAEPLRVRFRQRNGLGRAAHRDLQTLADERRLAFAKVRTSISTIIQDPEDLGTVTRFLSDAEQASEIEHERLSEQATILHDMHALGLLARFIVHEGRNLDSSLDSALSNLERVAQRSRTHKGDLNIEGENANVFDFSLKASRNIEQRLEGLLEQLDPLTRTRRKRRPHVIVEDVLQSVTTILKPDFTNAKVQLELPTGRHEVAAWEADLFHTLYNLLHNSLWWVQQGSGPRKISVKVRSRKDSRSTNGHLIEITVKDTGPGIPTKSADHIFELGYSEKPHGRGLGLFIVREAIHRSKGEVSLNNPGSPGAEFTINLQGT